MTPEQLGGFVATVIAPAAVGLALGYRLLIYFKNRKNKKESKQKE